MRVRFDDSLSTILSADMQPGVGAQSAWRQLVDLMSRGRIPTDEPTIARLRLLRQAVPDTVRAASARAVAFATPGAALVGFFAEDSLAVAAPVLRTAILPAADWVAILPRLMPAGRSVLRHRRDLPADVVRGLESFGSTDFVLHDDSAPVTTAPVADELAVDAPATITATEPAATPIAAVVEASPAPPAPDTPRSATPFVSLGDVARGLPVIAEALRRDGERRDAAPDAPDTTPAGDAPNFRIADLVARIDAFQRSRDPGDPPAALALPPATAFHYETDRDGMIRWVGGVARGPLIGVSLAQAVRQGDVHVDAAASGAIRQRTRFAQARLDIGGLSDAAGSWRIAGEPIFDHATGRFTGYRGVARRPRADEAATPVAPPHNDRADSLRQLVHELRTPTNAIAGFAELIETQLLGPVAPRYRDHAITIREQATALIAAIDDLDTLARIDGSALDQRPATLLLHPLVTRIVADLAPLVAVRHASIAVEGDQTIAARVDDRLGERLIARLLGTVVGAAAAGEAIVVHTGSAGETTGRVALSVTRPTAFGDRDLDALMRIDVDAADTGGVAGSAPAPGAAPDTAPDAGVSLLGVGFAMRLIRNLARELGGEMLAEADRLTLRLPAAVDAGVGQAIN